MFSISGTWKNVTKRLASLAIAIPGLSASGGEAQLAAKKCHTATSKKNPEQRQQQQQQQKQEEEGGPSCPL